MFGVGEINLFVTEGKHKHRKKHSKHSKHSKHLRHKGTKNTHSETPHSDLSRNEDSNESANLKSKEHDQQRIDRAAARLHQVVFDHMQGTKVIDEVKLLKEIDQVRSFCMFDLKREVTAQYRLRHWV